MWTELVLVFLGFVLGWEAHHIRQLVRLHRRLEWMRQHPVPSLDPPEPT